MRRGYSDCANVAPFACKRVGVGWDGYPFVRICGDGGELFGGRVVDEVAHSIAVDHLLSALDQLADESLISHLRSLLHVERDRPRRLGREVEVGSEVDRQGERSGGTRAKGSDEASLREGQGQGRGKGDAS